MKKPTPRKNPNAVLEAMFKGYGPHFAFTSAEQLLRACVATPEDTLRLMEPSPARGRYRKSTDFLAKVTSSYALGRKRYELFAKRLIALAREMKSYKGKHRKRKIIPKLTRADEQALLKLGNHIDHDVLAEALEKVTDHDTAAYADAFKILIFINIPHLRPFIEAVHFMDTSEDNWGNVTGLMLSELVFGHLVSAYLALCDRLLDFATLHDTGVWKLPEEYGGDKALLMPAFTHLQAATNSTHTKKVVTVVKQIVERLYDLTDGKRFAPFSGKFGGITGTYDSHFAAYPDIDWFKHGRKYVESLGLHYESMQNQCDTYAREAQHLRTLRTINEQILKLLGDFRFLVSCPGQLFIKQLLAGRKGSSSNPGKTNLWMIEGAERALRKTNVLLEFVARELQDYAQEGDMGRSYIMRDIGSDVSHIFIALDRVAKEMQQCVPNMSNLQQFIAKYPSLSMSSMQYVLKRERYAGDAYRAMQKMLINEDGSYATCAEFNPRFEQFMVHAQFPQELKQELRKVLQPESLIAPIHARALKEQKTLRNKIAKLRKMQRQTPSLKSYWDRQMQAAA